MSQIDQRPYFLWQAKKIWQKWPASSNSRANHGTKDQKRTTSVLTRPDFTLTRETEAGIWATSVRNIGWEANIKNYFLEKECCKEKKILLRLQPVFEEVNKCCLTSAIRFATWNWGNKLPTMHGQSWLLKQKQLFGVFLPILQWLQRLGKASFWIVWWCWAKTLLYSLV